MNSIEIAAVGSEVIKAAAAELCLRKERRRESPVLKATVGKSNPSEHRVLKITLRKVHAFGRQVMKHAAHKVDRAEVYPLRNPSGDPVSDNVVSEKIFGGKF